MKCRSTARHTPFHVRYSNEAKGLVLASEGEISGILNARKHKASSEDVAEHLENYLGDGCSMARRELLDRLCTDFSASNRTMEDRLKEIINDEMILHNSEGNPCNLKKESAEKVIYYKLSPIDANA